MAKEKQTRLVFIRFDVKDGDEVSPLIYPCFTDDPEAELKEILSELTPGLMVSV